MPDMDAVETLTQLTERDAQILYVLFVLCRDDEPREPSAIAARFKDASTQLITAALYKLRDVGAARFDALTGKPGWKADRSRHRRHALLLPRLAHLDQRGRRAEGARRVMTEPIPDVSSLALVSMPGHDDPWGTCLNCMGRHWLSTCGYPEDRQIGGACCGICEDVVCDECEDGDGMHPYGSALICDDLGRPLQTDTLRPVDFAGHGWLDYPWSGYDPGLYDERMRGEVPF